MGCGFPERSVTSAIQNLGGCSNFCGGTGSPGWMLMVFSGLGFGSSAPARVHATPTHVSPAATKRTSLKGRVRRTIGVSAGHRLGRCHVPMSILSPYRGLLRQKLYPYL